MQHYGDNFIPVVPDTKPPLHTADTPFCWDETCPCHEDGDALAEIHDAINAGIITPDDAQRILKGETV
jgi:hypothetical protein